MIEQLNIQLERDLVFFDLEATGLNVLKDRIVQIAFIKYFKDGREPIQMEMLVNPNMHMSQESIAIHGITPEMIQGEPKFEELADKLFSYFMDSDLAGYNSDRFDIPMLMEEFYRAGKVLDISKVNTIDVQKIFYKMEPRTLVAALKFYTGKRLENAHDALSDVKATVEVLQGMVQKYDGGEYEDKQGNVIQNPVKNNTKDLAEFVFDKRNVDVTNRLKRTEEGIVVFNFGKYIGQPVGEVLKKDKQYYKWIMEKDFSIQVKQIIDKLYKQNEAKVSGGNSLFDQF